MQLSICSTMRTPPLEVCLRRRDDKLLVFIEPVRSILLFFIHEVYAESKGLDECGQCGECEDMSGLCRSFTL